MERKSEFPLSHSDSPKTGWKLDKFDLAFAAREKGKDTTSGDIHEECIVRQIKQVDAGRPPKVTPGVDVRFQRFSTLSS